jgi:hypothetical protein
MARASERARALSLSLASLTASSSVRPRLRFPSALHQRPCRRSLGERKAEQARCPGGGERAARSRERTIRFRFDSFSSSSSFSTHLFLFLPLRHLHHTPSDPAPQVAQRRVEHARDDAVHAGFEPGRAGVQGEFSFLIARETPNLGTRSTHGRIFLFFFIGPRRDALPALHFHCSLCESIEHERSTSVRGRGSADERRRGSDAGG